MVACLHALGGILPEEFGVGAADVVGVYLGGVEGLASFEALVCDGGDGGSQRVRCLVERRFGGQRLGEVGAIGREEFEVA